MLIMLWIATADATANRDPYFQYKITAIPANYQRVMEQYTWHPGCPVPIKDLAYLTLSYWGFDQKTHTGVLIVNKKLALEVVAIFRELYLQKFPIERMEPMDAFKGDDAVAMAANNTYAFNCHTMINDPSRFSLHSYGYAISLNTLLNPHVTNDNQVLPPKGIAYLDRSKPVPGMIIGDNDAYQTFAKAGWAWGGNHVDQKAYHLFAKQP